VRPGSVARAASHISNSTPSVPASSASSCVEYPVAQTGSFVRLTS
jgi:hypothetical protein